MTPYYLKFTDEASAALVLNTPTDELQDADGVVIQEATSVPNYVNVSIIGTIYKPTGEVDAEGNPVQAAIEGWHVNVLTDTSPELETYRTYPTTPNRVWG